MRVTVIQREEELARLEPVWNDLLSRSASPNVFLSWEWLSCWWRHYGGPRRLFILVCLEGALPVAILPLFVSTAGLIPRSRMLSFLGSEGLCSDYLDCIVLEGHEQAAFQALADHLDTHRDHWDALLLQNLYEGSRFLHFLLSRYPPAGLEAGEKRCPYIRLPPTWEAFLASLTARKRHEIRHDRKALSRQGPIDVETISSPEELPAALADMARLHLARQNSRGLAGSFASSQYIQFHTEVCRRFLERGWLRLSFLTVAGQRVAFRYQIAFGHRLYDYQTGFDTAWSRHSVGLVLLSYLIERAIGEGLTELDFLRGTERYKYGWGEGGERSLVDVRILNHSLRGFLYGKQALLVAQARSMVKENAPPYLQDILRRAARTWT